MRPFRRRTKTIWQTSELPFAPQPQDRWGPIPEHPWAISRGYVNLDDRYYR